MMTALPCSSKIVKAGRPSTELSVRHAPVARSTHEVAETTDAVVRTSSTSPLVLASALMTAVSTADVAGPAADGRDAMRGGAEGLRSVTATAIAPAVLGEQRGKPLGVAQHDRVAELGTQRLDVDPVSDGLKVLTHSLCLTRRSALAQRE